MHQTLTLKVLATSLLAACLSLAACGDKTAENKTAQANEPTAKKTILFGTTVGDFGDMVKFSIKPILEKKGYDVKLIEFTDYVQPNLALSNGNIDVNIFQHKPYLDSFKAERNLALSPVFQVPTAPLGIYSGRLQKLEDAKKDMRVSVPNDPSNFARALVMMNDLGWITLKEGINPLTASERDIKDNKYNIQLVQLEAAQVPRSRNNVDFAIINGNYAVSSGVKLTTALYQEPSFAYVNWGVMRTKDIDQPWAKDVIAAYNSDEFKDYSHKTFEGYKWPANWTVEVKAPVKADEQTTTQETTAK
ncbi:hypothetical protein DM558_12570 [Entomomonas moraniae]|uniref:Lipoprotein n=1 Tax=Entomomonas moraniae TaxID=2213226 RepID=A0A3Q9JK94_9GAMM|nr:MetQ/NlpA family ABC transporter substrate-binding protein [Entomomonas moraniae]AZS51552.1 hypothetical protein DM558_12570 [Entomomonas moraniae]